jgi:exodeoxyribonuclease-3
VRLLSYNIRYGGRGREGALASVITACAPDVVVLQEASDAGVVARLAELTRLPHFGSRPGQSLGYLARQAPRAAEWRWLPSARHAHLDLQPAGTRWRIFGVHLRAMHVRWAERRRVLDVEALLRAVAPNAQAPHVLTGDFNSLPPGSALNIGLLPWRLRPVVWLGGRRLAWRAVEVLQEAGYTDAWSTVDGAQPGLTFPAPMPYLRLDYAFVPRSLEGAIGDCRPVTDVPGVRAASDHLPLLVTLDEGSTAAT